MISRQHAKDRGLNAARGIAFTVPVALVTWAFVIAGGVALWRHSVPGAVSGIVWMASR